MGTKLVRRKGLIFAAALLICVGCERERAHRGVSQTSGPGVNATVVTIQTTIQPAAKSFAHSMTIAGDVVRLGGDLDQWRLFDVKQKTVTFVDDVAKTYRIEPLAVLLSRRTRALAQPLPPGIPPVRVASSGAKKQLQGVSASQLIFRAGGWSRELWLAEHPLIPRDLFAMILASEIPTSTLASMARDADTALMKTHGFPLAEHAELPYLDKKLIVDRTVVKIEKRSVPAASLAVPSGYKELPSIAAPEPKPASRPHERRR